MSEIEEKFSMDSRTSWMNDKWCRTMNWRLIQRILIEKYDQKEEEEKRQSMQSTWFGISLFSLIIMMMMRMMMMRRWAWRKKIFHLMVDLNRAIVWIIGQMKINRPSNVKDQLLSWIIEKKNGLILDEEPMALSNQSTWIEIFFVMTIEMEQSGIQFGTKLNVKLNRWRRRRRRS